MTVVELIRNLQKLHDEHGDIDVLGYTDAPETEYSNISLEYSNDDAENPVILLTLED